MWFALRRHIINSYQQLILTCDGGLINIDIMPTYK